MNEAHREDVAFTIEFLAKFAEANAPVKEEKSSVRAESEIVEEEYKLEVPFKDGEDKEFEISAAIERGAKSKASKLIESVYKMK